MENTRQITLDEFKRPTLTVDQAVDLMLCGGNLCDSLYVDSEDVDTFNTYGSILKTPLKLNEDKSGYISLDQYHAVHSNIWYIPQNYLDLNVWEYVLQLCSTDDELLRVEQELILFEERNMFDLLRLLIFLVDHFRHNGYVWGVGRGSSVASYCLYLIGVHKVDSIKYKLDIGEFLK